MKITNEKMLKKISGIGTLIFLALSIILEVIRKNIPPMTLTPTFYEHLFSILRNISLVFLAILFTVFIFLTLKRRLGILNAVFITLISDSFIAFLIGALIMVFSTLSGAGSLGMTAIESIYLYLLGMLTALVSGAIFAALLVVFLLVRLIMYIISKNKKS